MSDDLYDIDALAWSERQAELLRRVVRGERVNDIDWPHIIEEVEDVGLSQLRALRSLLRQALVHLLKLQGWPDCDAAAHWRWEAQRFLIEAKDCFAPSMRQRAHLADLYRDASAQVEGNTIDGHAPKTLPAECPFALDDLLANTPDLAVPEAKLRNAG